MRKEFIEIEYRLQARKKLLKLNNNLYYARSSKDRNKENRFSHKRFNAIEDKRNFITSIIKIIVTT